MATRKLLRIGTSIGVVLPKKMLGKMRLTQGDYVFFVEARDGYVMTPYDPHVAAQVDMGRIFISRHRDTFKVLSK